MEWLGTAPAWITALTAVFASRVALRQLGMSASAQEMQVQIARANLLLSIDREFESEASYASRKACRSLANAAEASALATNPRDRAPDAIRKLVATEFSHQLNELWNVARELQEKPEGTENAPAIAASDRYATLMALPNWIETVGMLCRRDLLPKEDVLDLYDEAIIRTMTNFESHIVTRGSEQPYDNPLWLENARWLLEEAKTYNKQKREPAKAPVSKSRLDWLSAAKAAS
ncbi:hypothetical protein Saro_3044 [Novosphingobium aromaticivorans DSM 12444]|uniref:DUF4760 domain-containing protein n=1 Tax=Novosphingobium aromaticivorans (strain ATCC 700278 / DSM 12444 / CCUG 56034 / CIP 105152 / NBRC 16084 / F199) TaxID=279238 RepID=Q2G3U4_NOVAD|nr:hypothetical protein [Novosphingobium aromaticivorans]ABD27479.1 hypothetical protein Saro_3044 [Novosphingobium aromaticivorans DSM 12444]SCY70219.1 hypothetical protein SAMN05660666_02558 [Novosphingobium aromaticivorans]